MMQVMVFSVGLGSTVPLAGFSLCPERAAGQEVNTATCIKFRTGSTYIIFEKRRKYHERNVRC